ncbi:MAG TPA: LptE family protein [Syntrophorhabdaceae bacterium]|jgi:outer membrane lipopolysaccharide assembly protein LptE/RlpB
MGKKEKRSTGRLLLLIALAMVVCSCGYQLVTDRGIYGGDIKSLSLPTFKNITYEPHVSLYVTNAFSRELVSMGLFQLNTPDTDAYLEGSIQRIVILPASMNSSGLVIEKQATMSVDIALYRKNGSFIKRWVFSDTEPYRVDDVNLEEYNKRAAFEVISGRIARKFSAVLLVEY